jgi:hypothetical protein
MFGDTITEFFSYMDGDTGKKFPKRRFGDDIVSLPRGDSVSEQRVH